MNRGESLQTLISKLADDIGIEMNDNDPCGFKHLPEEQWSKSDVYHPNCYICNDPDFATHGMPLCFACSECGGHVSADDDVCDVCGFSQLHESVGLDFNIYLFPHDELIITSRVPTRYEICIKSGYESLCGKKEFLTIGHLDSKVKYPTCYKCLKIFYRVVELSRALKCWSPILKDKEMREE